jgi:RNA polymerase sigma-70 factor (ECF subfamily)
MSEQRTLDTASGSKDFNALLVAHLPQLRRQALALTRHKADAEDLLQTAVTSAIIARESFTPGTNFKAWVTCILRNRFLSNIRQRRMLVDLGDVPEGLLGRNGQQEGYLEIIELKRQMLRLPADQLMILLMISVEGMSYDDASVQLGIAAGTLKCRVFRARAQLEAWMHGQEGTDKLAPCPTRRNAAVLPYARRSPAGRDASL